MKVRPFLLSILPLSFTSGEVSDPQPSCERGEESDPDYLIVGAGGSGIQMALFLEQHGYSYKILEKTNDVGSFWTKFPVFDELISVNKWNRNETQRWRYDWHSFLQAPLKMLDVTEEYFPNGEDWHNYMSLVAEKAGIMPNIEFNMEVDEVETDGSPCLYLMDDTKRCAKKRIFIGTGLEEKAEPYLEAIGGIPYSKITKELARHKNVCILGNGNSGFEVAQNLFGVAERVILFGREPHRLSSVTRYTGDVRTKYLQVLENMNGKLLDDVGYFMFKLEGKFEGLDPLTKEQVKQLEDTMQALKFVKEFNCERLVLTTGFQSRVPFGLNEAGLRFPRSSDWYRSTENPSVHYIGWLMHERDFRQGAGGFLSGYRYLIRNLFQQLHAENHNKPYPYHSFSKEEAVRKAIERFQTADDLVILQDGVAIRDVIVPQGDGTFHFYEGITYGFHNDIFDTEGAVSLYFAWGDGRSAEKVFDGIVRYSDTNSLMNRFLHPVVEVGELKRDVHEDHQMTWTEQPYVDALERVVDRALDGNLTDFAPKTDLSYKRGEVNQTEYEHYEIADLYGHMREDEWLRSIATAVYTGGNPQALEKLRRLSYHYNPDLVDYRNETFPSYKEEIIAAFQPTARDTDVITVSPEKCGQTWLTTLLYHLKVKEPIFGKDLLQEVPWLEKKFNILEAKARVKNFNSMNDPRIFKMHTTWDEIPVPPNVKAKIIALSRDPRDVPYSMYAMENPDTTFEDYVENEWLHNTFYIEHLRSFWPRRNDDNLLWLTFEMMKATPVETANKIVEFLGWKATNEEVERAVELSSFDSMKEKKSSFLNSKLFHGDFVREGGVGKNCARLSNEMEQKILDHIRSNVSPEALEFVLSEDVTKNSRLFRERGETGVEQA